MPLKAVAAILFGISIALFIAQGRVGGFDGKALSVARDVEHVRKILKVDRSSARKQLAIDTEFVVCFCIAGMLATYVFFSSSVGIALHMLFAGACTFDLTENRLIARFLFIPSDSIAKLSFTSSHSSSPSTLDRWHFQPPSFSFRVSDHNPFFSNRAGMELECR